MSDPRNYCTMFLLLWVSLFKSHSFLQILVPMIASIMDFPGGSVGKSLCLQCGRPGFEPWVGKIPWRRKWQSTPGLLPRKSHWQRSLVGYSPWGRKESDTTERLHFIRNIIMMKISTFTLLDNLKCVYFTTAWNNKIF